MVQAAAYRNILETSHFTFTFGPALIMLQVNGNEAY